MNSSVTNMLFFSVSILVGMVMIVEGCLIVLLKKQVTPLPSRVLYGLGALVSGKAHSQQQFLGRTSPKGLREYAWFVLIFGPVVVVSSFVYLFTTIL